MIALQKVFKSYRTTSGVHRVLNGVDAVFPRGKSVGILGKNGAGKTTLLRLIGGVESPDRGHIRRRVRVSWPIGFSGGFHGSLSGRENVRFISRIYRVDLQKVMRFVEEFSELGDYMDMPYKTYSSGMKAKLAFGLSMAIDFDCYLVDEVTAVGDATFQKKCRETFSQRRTRSNLIMVSHSVSTIKQYCDMAAVLSGGQLVFFEDIDKAINFYNNAELKAASAVCSLSSALPKKDMPVLERTA